MVSPDPQRWTRDPAVPGAFIWLSRDGGSTPAALAAERSHPACVAVPVRTSRQAGVEWQIASFRECPDGRREIVEAVGTRPGTDGLVYVQIAPPASSAPAFVDTLLAGLKVRWPD